MLRTCGFVLVVVLSLDSLCLDAMPGRKSVYVPRMSPAIGLLFCIRGIDAIATVFILIIHLMSVL